MDGDRKRAYRFLLYWACCTDLRSTAWFRMVGASRWNPFLSRGDVRQIRRAGRVGDWLHNLALFSMLDFEGFDEAWFWREYEALVRDFGEDVVHYRRMFERELVELATKRASSAPVVTDVGGS